jgi:hypothetical protein
LPSRFRSPTCHLSTRHRLGSGLPLFPGFPFVAHYPFALQVRFESAGINGVSQVLRRSSPCMPCPDDPGRPPESHQSDSFTWASRKRKRLPPASLSAFRGCTRPQGGAVSLTAYMVPCVRFRPFVQFVSRLTSYGSATLGTGGWLDLTRQGLTPCKKRQACLGAHAVALQRAGGEADCPLQARGSAAPFLSRRSSQWRGRSRSSMTRSRWLTAGAPDEVGEATVVLPPPRPRLKQ